MQTKANMARHVLISGLVQGVGFRYHFMEQAQGLGITDWCATAAVAASKR